MSELTILEWFDVIGFLILLVILIRGFIIGLSESISSMLAMVTAVVVFILVFRYTRGMFFSDFKMLSDFICLVSALLGAGLAGALVREIVTPGLKMMIIQPFNSILGGVWAFMVYAVIMCALLFVLRIQPFGEPDVKLRDRTKIGGYGYAVLDYLFGSKSSDSVGK